MGAATEPSSFGRRRARPFGFVVLVAFALPLLAACGGAGDPWAGFTPDPGGIGQWPDAPDAPIPSTEADQIVAAIDVDGGVRIRPGDDVRAVVRSQPAGTTFVFEAGVHRLADPVEPRAGDTFVGLDGAVVRGSRLLTSFGRDGALWYASDQRQEGRRQGECTSAAPRCNHPEELFIDGQPLRHVGSKSAVVPGTFWFDYAADRIYFADDPSGRRVEASVASGAFVGDARGVTIANLTIEQFANPAQRGVVMAERYGDRITYGDWTIVRNLVQYGHGVGVRAGGGSIVLANRILHHGQLGIGSQGPGDTRFEGNEIAYNNRAGYVTAWEGGGSKFALADGLLVQGNHVHHNLGPGLWSDVDNVHVRYLGNLVEHNAETGIFHEISNAALVADNVVRFNGFGLGLDSYAYVFGAGILIYASRDVEVTRNVVYGNLNGIVGLQHDRGTGPYGPRELRDLYVHDNVVGMQWHGDRRGPQGERGVPAVSGIAQAGGFGFVFDASGNNRFVANEYVVEDDGDRHFTWRDGGHTFAAWQGTYRQDPDGVLVEGEPVDLAYD